MGWEVWLVAAPKGFGSVALSKRAPVASPASQGGQASEGEGAERGGQKTPFLFFGQRRNTRADRMGSCWTASSCGGR
jgi:hypothetical protein